jgi:putative restriction endonuclease
MARIPAKQLNRVNSKHIIEAVEKLVGGAEIQDYGPSTDYDVVLEDGTRLAPKAVFGHAATKALGFTVLPRHFVGGSGTPCFKAIQAAGYEVVPKGADIWTQNIGEDEQVEAAILREIGRSNLLKTEKLALVKSRIGQGRYRDDLERLWDGSCAVTGVSTRSLLRASHSKPWITSNNRERLDPYNGFLLLAQYDAAFDSCLISFGAEGEILVSPKVSSEELALAGINPSLRIKGLNPRHQPYLNYHRQTLFKK